MASVDGAEGTAAPAAGRSLGPSDGRHGGCPMRGTTGDIPFNPALAAYGRTFLTSMLVGWWRGRRKWTCGDDPGEALRRIAGGACEVEVEGGLRTWLEHLGLELTRLSPLDARRLLGVWRQESERQPALWTRGSRQRPGAVLRNGRPNFKQRSRLTALLLESGEACTAAGEIAERLWAHRAPLWASVPARPDGGAPILDAYFAGREAHFPETPPVSRAQLEGHILRARGSAPWCGQRAL